eukprot:411078-Prymnesium_polylepis.1
MIHLQAPHPLRRHVLPAEGALALVRKPLVQARPAEDVPARRDRRVAPLPQAERARARLRSGFLRRGSLMRCRKRRVPSVEQGAARVRRE